MTIYFRDICLLLEQLILSTHYGVLSIREDAGDSEIEEAYLQGVAGCNTRSPLFTYRLRLLDESRAVLIDPSRRRPYDAHLQFLQLLTTTPA